MSKTQTIPAIGDEYTYEVIVSHADYWFAKGREAGHKILGFQKGRECSPGRGNRSCPKCYDQWEERTSRIVDVQRFMDNSTELVLEDGKRVMYVQPHGDVCF